MSFENSIFIKTILSLTNLPIESESILQDLLIQLVDAMNNGHSGLVVEDYLLDKNLANLSVDISLINIIQVLKNSNICDFFVSSNTVYSNILILVPLKANKTNILYFNRYYQYELNIANKVHHLSQMSQLPYHKIKSTLLDCQLPKDFPNHLQTQAIINIASNKFSILTGGPGTGKTTTIFLLILLLLRLYQLALKIAIIAPTGKAVNRAKQSVESSLKSFASLINISQTEIETISSIHYKTIHKFLGYTTNANTFKYNSTNHLDYDIIIVDESSMVSLSLYNSLLLAISPNNIKHLVLLGDKNQLSSVEEGHVFADLIVYHEIMSKSSLLPSICVNYLIDTNRNSGDILDLSVAILKEDKTKIIDIINNSNTIKHNQNQLSLIIKDMLNQGGIIDTYIRLVVENGNFELLSQHFYRSTILCDKNIGSLGTDNINKIIDNYIREQLNHKDIWYHGRVIIILENNQYLGLVNGDIGVCIKQSDEYKIAFSNNNLVLPQLLPKYSLAYAITIHKSQGSEYDNVVIVLSDNNNLTKELIYTAVTRAKHNIVLYTKLEHLLYAISNKTNRYSGLSYFLQNI